MNTFRTYVMGFIVISGVILISDMWVFHESLQYIIKYDWYNFATLFVIVSGVGLWKILSPKKQ